MIYGIPGVRLGYLATSEKNWVECLKRQLPEWNVSLLAQCAGAAALQEDEFVQKTSEYVKKAEGIPYRKASFARSYCVAGRGRLFAFLIQRRIYMKCC